MKNNDNPSHSDKNNIIKIINRMNEMREKIIQHEKPN